MREYFRPYNKVITLPAEGVGAGGAAVNVELNDSAGAPLACNYVSVTQVSGDATVGFFQVIPSGVNTLYGGASAADGGSVSARDSGPVSYTDASSRTSNEVSGSLGIIASVGGGTAILSLAPYDATKAIILSHNSNSAATYAVTYGQVNLANSRADVVVDMDEVTYTSAIADFTYASGVNGASTSAFTFTDTSEGNPIAWLWDFNFANDPAANTSTKQNPTFDYTGVADALGSTVKLIITTLHSAAQGPAKAETKVLA